MAYNTGASSGNLVLIEKQVASNDASIDFTTGIDSRFSDYYFSVTNYLPATNSTRLILRVSTDGGSSYISAGYVSTISYANMTASLVEIPTVSVTDGVNLAFGQDNSGNSISLKGYIYNVTNGLPGNMTGDGIMLNSGSNYLCTFGSVFNQTNIDAIRFISSSGNITSGTFKLYGVAD